MNILFIRFSEIPLIERIAERAGKILHAEIKISEKIEKIPRCEMRGGQLNANDFLPAVYQAKGDADFALGIVDKDLYVQGLNFVFGLSFPIKKIAVISTARLFSPDKKLYVSRAVKEAVHEIGHLLGLSHCGDPRCVMHFSNSLSDTDYKGEDFCEGCKKELKI